MNYDLFASPPPTSLPPLSSSFFFHHDFCPPSLSRSLLLPVPASRNEFQSIRLQLESETLPPERPGDPPRSFHSLTPVEQASMEKKRLAGRSANVQIQCESA